jgi:hypothetical protein
VKPAASNETTERILCLGSASPDGLGLREMTDMTIADGARRPGNGKKLHALSQQEA